jgi:hypothetical protein
MMSVTVDNINVFAAKAEKLSFMKLGYDAISLAVDDLLVYQNYFDSPLKFLHFLKLRRAATTVKQIAPDDELDHLGMYIFHSCYSMQFEKRINLPIFRWSAIVKNWIHILGNLYYPALSPNRSYHNCLKQFSLIWIMENWKARLGLV